MRKDWWKRNWNITVHMKSGDYYIRCYGSVFRMISRVIKLAWKKLKGEMHHEQVSYKLTREVYGRTKVD